MKVITAHFFSVLGLFTVYLDRDSVTWICMASADGAVPGKTSARAPLMGKGTTYDRFLIRNS